MSRPDTSAFLRSDTITVLGAIALGAILVTAGVAVAGVGPGAQTIERVPAAASQPGDSDEVTRAITVAASGEASAQPDEAVIRVAVRATADDPTVARSRVAENVSRMRGALSELGLDDDQVLTVDYDIHEDRPHPREEGDEQTTYRASHELAIRVTDVERVGTVVDAAVDSGATNVYDVQFTLSDETQSSLRQEALADAMSSARTQAGTLATAANLELGGVHRVNTRDVRYPSRGLHLETAVAGDGGGTDIDSGPVTVTASVTVTFNATG